MGWERRVAGVSSSACPPASPPTPRLRLHLRLLPALSRPGPIHPHRRHTTHFPPTRHIPLPPHSPPFSTSSTAVAHSAAVHPCPAASQASSRPPTRTLPPPLPPLPPPHPPITPPPRPHPPNPPSLTHLSFNPVTRSLCQHLADGVSSSPITSCHGCTRRGAAYGARIVLAEHPLVEHRASLASPVSFRACLEPPGTLALPGLDSAPPGAPLLPLTRPPAPLAPQNLMQETVGLAQLTSFRLEAISGPASAADGRSYRIK